MELDDSIDSTNVCRKVLVTVHGIRTFGQWQERLEELVLQRSSEIAIEHYHYGYFSVLGFLVPPLRWLSTIRFRRHVREISTRYPNSEISFVAHSFGTHLVGHGLYGMKKELRPKVSTVILAGSVLRTSFPWGDLINLGAVKQVINDCGIQDNILLLSQVFVLFTGMAGRLGFRGMTSRKILNRYFNGGHSHYFEDRSGPTDKFMEEFWVPVLTDNIIVPAHDDRSVGGPLQGVVLTLLQLSDPMKSLAYAFVLFALTYVFYWQPKAEAQLSQVRALQSEIKRDLFLATVYYENRKDIPRAVQVMAASVREGGLISSDLIAQRRILSFWLQSLTKLHDVVQWEGGSKVVHWYGTYYGVGKKSVRELFKAYVIASTRISDDRAFLLGDDGIARIVNFNTLEVEREIHLPMPKESMEDQWGEAKFNKSLFDKFRYLERSNGKADLEDLVNFPPVDELDSNKADTEVSEESFIKKLNTTDRQREDLQALDLYALNYDPISNLVIGLGRTRSHDLGGNDPAIQVFDPDTGKAAAFTYSITYGTPIPCRSFVAQFSNGDSLVNVEIGLRKGRVGELFMVSPPKEVSSSGNWGGDVFDGCNTSLIDGSLDFNLKFPSIKDEKIFWSDVHSQEPVQQSGKVMDVDEGGGGVGISEKVEREAVAISESSQSEKLREGWQFSGLENNGLSVGWLYLMEYAKREYLPLSWDASIRWNRGSDGSKYGVYNFCKVEDDIAKACARVRCWSDYCSEIWSREDNFVAVSSYGDFGNESIYVLDINSVSFIRLPSTPEGAVVDARFSNKGESSLSVISSQGEMWVYKSLREKVKVASTSLISRSEVDDFGRNVLDLILRNGDPIAILDNNSVARIDRFNAVPVWVTGKAQLPGKGSLQVKVSQSYPIAVVFNDSAIRLIDSETGVFLSDAIDFEDRLKLDRDNGGVSTLSNDKIHINADGSVVVRGESFVVQRESPLSEGELIERLSYIEGFTGLDSIGQAFSNLSELYGKIGTEGQGFYVRKSDAVIK